MKSETAKKLWANPKYRKMMLDARPKNFKMAQSTKDKIGSANKGVNNGMWKDNVGYSALHEWVKKYLFKPEFCQDCGIAKPVDLANISQEYKRDLSDWEWLCRRCHMIKDGRLLKLNPNAQITR